MERMADADHTLSPRQAFAIAMALAQASLADYFEHIDHADRVPLIAGAFDMLDFDDPIEATGQALDVAGMLAAVVADLVSTVVMLARDARGEDVDPDDWFQVYAERFAAQLPEAWA